MELNQLRYFLALSKQEHMSLTADILGISQPALSKSIANLEKELGVELFDRRGNRLKLNRNGQEFAFYVSRIFLDLETGKRALHQYHYDFRGHIDIACRAFGDLLMDCVTDYMNLNPHIRVSLYQSQRGDDSLSDRIDFLLSSTGNSGNLDLEWVSQPLYTEEAYILISPTYREFPPECTSLAPIELKDEFFISDFLVSETFTGVDLIHRMCLNAGFKPKVRFYTDDFNTKIRLVNDGKGITVLPHSCLRMAYHLAPTLRSFRIDGFNTQRTVSLLHKKDCTMTETAADFWEFVKDYYSTRPKG